MIIIWELMKSSKIINKDLILHKIIKLIFKSNIFL